MMKVGSSIAICFVFSNLLEFYETMSSGYHKLHAFVYDEHTYANQFTFKQCYMA